jgi:hypothetical protein
MFRRTLLVSVLVLGGTVVWLGLSGLARTQDKPKTTLVGKGPNFVHTVIFHLKKDAPAAEVEALITDARELLRPIPSVRDLKIGRPADKGTPDRAKKDFQVGLVVLFNDQAGLETYLNHPMHLKYVEKHLKYIDAEKLSVYDFVDQKP